MIKIKHTEFPLINAVLDEKQEGKIYQDEYSGSYLIVHKSAFGYLFAESESNYKLILDFFLKDSSIPIYFHLYSPPAELISLIQNDERFGYKLRKRIQFRYLKSEINHKSIIPANYHLELISSDNFKYLNVFKLDLGTKFWKSEGDFLQNGYGSVVFYNKTNPVSICYTSCVAENIAEIDIATLPEFQGKGFAKIVAKHFINLSIKKVCLANWDCFEDNKPSLNTAHSLGFTLLREYNFLSIYNKLRTDEMD